MKKGVCVTGLAILLMQAPYDTRLLPERNSDNLSSYGFWLLVLFSGNCSRIWLLNSEFEHKFTFYSYSWFVYLVFKHGKCILMQISVSKLRSPGFHFCNGVFREPGSPSLHVLFKKLLEARWPELHRVQHQCLLWNVSEVVFVDN